MLFGHNTNVTLGGMQIHVQTEDRGISHAMIDTTVYHRGRVLHRRTKSYSDLLPLNADREQALKIRLDDQHFAVVEELRSGTLQVVLPSAPRPTSAAANPAPAAKAAARPEPGIIPLAKLLSIELLNPRTWLTGKHATLYLVVRHREGNTPAAAAQVVARVHGAAEATEVSTTTGADGHAQLQFEMPRLVSEETALVIEAVAGEARGHLRFQLRAKPKVPAGG
jgi:hypothetical protein